MFYLAERCSTLGLLWCQCDIQIISLPFSSGQHVEGSLKKKENVWTAAHSSLSLFYLHHYQNICVHTVGSITHLCARLRIWSSGAYVYKMTQEACEQWGREQWGNLRLSTFSLRTEEGRHVTERFEISVRTVFFPAVCYIRLLVRYRFLLQTGKWHWCNVTAMCTAQQLSVRSFLTFNKTTLLRTTRDVRMIMQFSQKTCLSRLQSVHKLSHMFFLIRSPPTERK